MAFKSGFNIDASGYKYVSGIWNFRQNLEKVAGAMKGAGLEGLRQAQAKIHRDMESISPTIPKEFGNLRKSYFCVNSNGTIIAGSSPGFTDERKDTSTLNPDHIDAVNNALDETASRAKTYGPNIILGFSAYYAIYVHEMPKKTNWTLPGSGPKFFEKHVAANKDLILNTMQKSIRNTLRTAAGLEKSMRKWDIR